jgi:hypothetical protein
VQFGHVPPVDASMQAFHFMQISLNESLRKGSSRHDLQREKHFNQNWSVVISAEKLKLTCHPNHTDEDGFLSSDSRMSLRASERFLGTLKRLV